MAGCRSTTAPPPISHVNVEKTFFCSQKYARCWCGKHIFFFPHYIFQTANSNCKICTFAHWKRWRWVTSMPSTLALYVHRVMVFGAFNMRAIRVPSGLGLIVRCWKVAVTIVCDFGRRKSWKEIKFQWNVWEMRLWKELHSTWHAVHPAFHCSLRGTTTRKWQAQQLKIESHKNHTRFGTEETGRRSFHQNRNCH